VEDFIYKFRAHDTFFIRKGWLAKGVKHVLADPAVFVSREANPMDTLGIGANMVKAMRYWLQAVGLTEETKSGRREQMLTTLGEIIHENDPYMEELGTLWLLHYNLATNRDEATAWYYFFNEFKLVEFTSDDFLTHIKGYLRINGKDVADQSGDDGIAKRSIEEDYACVINTYVSRMKSNPEKVQPESNIDCPLGELGLIDIVNRKAKIYKKSSPKKDTLDPLILLAVILKQADGEKSVRISEIQSNSECAGKVFNLDIISLTSLLYKIEIMGYIKVVRTAGLDVIEIKTKWSFYDTVRAYYHKINEKEVR
jgi:hypothetical protein